MSTSRLERSGDPRAALEAATVGVEAPPGSACPGSDAGSAERPAGRRRHLAAGAGRGSAYRVARGALTVAASLAALTALLDEVAVRFVAGNSDGATVILEGAAVNSGNLALHGWAISLDSFWTLDVVVYALAVRFWGLGPDLLTLVPAILAAGLIVLGAGLAIEHRRGLPALVAAGTVVALLALPGPDLAFYLLQGPWHIGTVLAALAAFGALARPDQAWRWALGVVLLAAGLLGDVMILTIGVLPAGACGVLSLLRSRRSGSRRPGLALLAAAPASCLLALAARVVAQAAGTFTLVNRNVPIRLHQVAANVLHLGNRVPGLLGVGSIPSSPPDGSAGFQLAHVAGLAFVLAAVLAGAVSVLAGAARGRPTAVLDAPRPARHAGDGGNAGGGRGAGGAPAWRLDDLLVVGVLADLVTFVWAAGSDNPDYAKYLTPGLAFAVVLAGRYAGRYAERLARPARLTQPPGPAQAARLRNPPSDRSRAVGRSQARRRPPPGLLALAALLLAAVYAAEVGAELGGPLAVQPAAQLASFLRSHHLREGVGDYWSSSIVTVESRGAVLVRPVTPAAGLRLRRYERQSPESWYAGQRFDFFVYDTAHPWRNVNATTAVRTWGAPAETLAVGTYRVLVWSRPFSVSTVLPHYGSPLQIFWRPGPPRSSSTTSTTSTTLPAAGITG